MQITFTIPDGKVPRVIDAMKGWFRIPKILSDPDDPTSEKIPEFTDAQWAKEVIRRFIRDAVYKFEKKQAEIALNIQRDDEIAS